MKKRRSTTDIRERFGYAVKIRREGLGKVVEANGRNLLQSRTAAANASRSSITSTLAARYLTQEDLAEKASIHRTYLSDIDWKP
jgi:uncharacterized protein (DUF39 family)